MGMVFQNYAVWPHKTVFENVVFGLKLRKVPSAEAKRQVEETLALVNLTGLEGRYPNELSGGQQQRVALARSLVVEPDILLLDEPLSNLDAKLRERMRVELKELQRRTGITFVYVTHDQAEALALSDQVAVMNAGRLQQFGTPLEVYARPGKPHGRGLHGAGESGAGHGCARSRTAAERSRSAANSRSMSPGSTGSRPATASRSRSGRRTSGSLRRPATAAQRRRSPITFSSATSANTMRQPAVRPAAAGADPSAAAVRDRRPGCGRDRRDAMQRVSP